MGNDIYNRKVYNECATKPHCPAVNYISDDAIFVNYDENANCPYRINLGDINICENIGRIRYYIKYGR
jgi:hypothetical protein